MDGTAYCGVSCHLSPRQEELRKAAQHVPMLFFATLDDTAVNGEDYSQCTIDMDLTRFLLFLF